MSEKYHFIEMYKLIIRTTWNVSLLEARLKGTHEPETIDQSSEYPDKGNIFFIIVVWCTMCFTAGQTVDKEYYFGIKLCA